MVTMKSLEIPSFHRKGILMLLTVYSGTAFNPGHFDHPDVLSFTETIGGYSLLPLVKSSQHGFQAGEIEAKPVEYNSIGQDPSWKIDQYIVSARVGLLSMKDIRFAGLCKKLQEVPYLNASEMPGIFVRLLYGVSANSKYLYEYFAFGLVPGFLVDGYDPIIISSGWKRRIKQHRLHS